MSRGKRLLDVAASTVGLMLLLPVFAVVAAAVKFDDGGPIFFRQERVGRDGRPFRIWKFRTMVVDAGRVGPQITVGADRRITRVGARLRRLKADELPQLVNVLLGDMTLVGPRPEVPKYVALYTPEQRQVLRYRPGITDPASILYRNENEILARASDPEAMYVQDVMPRKIEINLEYAARATLIDDIAVILKTIGVLGVEGREPSP